jgi:hypothetical protein
MTSESERVKVLFIGGYSRSGSTLLDCMLGQLPGVVSTGELAYIWTHGLQENRLCGCGRQFLQCRFWAKVGELAFGGWSEVDADEMRSLELAVNRHRFVPMLMAPRPSRRYSKDLQRYSDVLARIFRAIQQVGGARLIVDSTIDPAYGFLLSHVDELDLRLVHLVRDSRATAFSWTRWQRRCDRVDAVVYQRRFHPAASAVRWSAYHTLVHMLGASRGLDPLLVHYEDVVAAPRREITRIMEHAGEPVDPGMLGFLRRGELDLEVNHTVAGSLMRLHHGPMRLREDDEWRRGLSPLHRRTTTLLSWPLLAAYGYVARHGMAPGQAATS